MITTLDKPDIIEIFSNEGIELRRRGSNYWASCPLHTEHTPSFKVNPDSQSFYCFGCNEHGDVITFIQKYHGMTFKDALKHLGISSGRPSLPDPVQMRVRELKQVFLSWKHEYCLKLADMLRWLDELKSLFRDMDEVQIFSDYYHEESMWQHEFDILTGTDEREKFELFKRWWHENKN